MGKVKQFMIEAGNDPELAKQLMHERSQSKTRSCPMSPKERFMLVCESKDKTLMNCVRGGKSGCKRVCTLFIEDPSQLGYRIVHNNLQVTNRRVRAESVEAYLNRLEKKEAKNLPF